MSLPIGWEAKFDVNSGRIFFIDHRNKTTHWNDPRPLPPGWEAKRDPNNGNREFFISHTEHKTTWVDPRPKIDLSKLVVEPDLPKDPITILKDGRTVTLRSIKTAQPNDAAKSVSYLDQYDNEGATVVPPGRCDIWYFEKHFSLAITAIQHRATTFNDKTMTLIDIAKIKNIRLGKHSLAFSGKDNLPVDCCFSIVMTSQPAVVYHFQTSSPDTRPQIVSGLVKLNPSIQVVDANKETVDAMNVKINMVANANITVSTPTNSNSNNAGGLSGKLEVYCQMLRIAMTDTISPDKANMLHKYREDNKITDKLHNDCLSSIGYSVDEFHTCQNDKTDVLPKCSICLDSVVDHACLPCFHMCLCLECASGSKCPMCSAPVDRFQKIFY